MITQNVSLSNAKEGKYKKWNKLKLNPGLALIGLSGIGPKVVLFIDQKLGMTVKF